MLFLDGFEDARGMRENIGGVGGGKMILTFWKDSGSSHELLGPMPAFSIRNCTPFLNFDSTFPRRSFHSSILLTSIQ